MVLNLFEFLDFDLDFKRIYFKVKLDFTMKKFK